MITKKLILGTAVAALMAGGAIAQDSAPNSNPDATTPPAVTAPDGNAGGSLDNKDAAPETTGSTNAMDESKPSDESAAAPSDMTVAGGPINFVSNLSDGQVEVSELTGKQVVNSAGEELGDIDDLILDREGKPAIAVIGVGGFLGLGEKAVGVPFANLEMVPNEDGEISIRLNASKEDLANAPTYEGESRQAAAPDGVAPSVTEPNTDAPAATDAEPVNPAAPAAPNAQ